LTFPVVPYEVGNGIEQQEGGHQVGYGIGIHDNQQGDYQRNHSDYGKLEGKKKQQSEQAQKPGEGDGEEFRKDANQQSGDNGERRQCRGDLESDKDDAQEYQVASGYQVKKVRVNQGKQSGN